METRTQLKSVIFTTDIFAVYLNTKHTYKLGYIHHYFFEGQNWRAILRGNFSGDFGIISFQPVHFNPKIYIPYACHYKPWFVYFFTPFPKTIYILWPLALCMACIQERLLIKSGLWWRMYGICNFQYVITNQYLRTQN